MNTFHFAYQWKAKSTQLAAKCVQSYQDVPICRWRPHFTSYPPLMSWTDITLRITLSSIFSHDILASVEELRTISWAQFGVQQCVLGAISSQLPPFLPNHAALWHILGRREAEWACFAVHRGDLTADVSGASLSAKLDRQSASRNFQGNVELMGRYNYTANARFIRLQSQCYVSLFCSNCTAFSV